MLQEVIRCMVRIGGRHQVAVEQSVASEAFGGSEAIVPNKIVLFVSLYPVHLQLGHRREV